MDSIKDMKCPVCGCAEKFEIEIGTTLVIYNSDDEFTWKAGSDCECGNEDCDFSGTVADFVVETATEPAKHTPGPWEVGEDFTGEDLPDHDKDIYIGIHCDGGTIALVDGTPIDNLEVGANARLIAAAPDMKRELGQTISDMRSLLSLIDAEGYAEGVDLLAIVEIANQVADRHAAAIAKAEGRTTC